jgi:hypothetical protein
MKKTLLAATLMLASAAANAVTWAPTGTVTRTQDFNNIPGIDSASRLEGTTLEVGDLKIDDNFEYSVTFTYLGEESGFVNKFRLLVNGAVALQEGDAQGTTATAIFNKTNFNFNFEGDLGKFAINGGTKSPGTSIGLIGTGLTVSTLPVNMNTFAFVLGYNDSAGEQFVGDWDDFVIGVNFARGPNEIPEPSTYMLMLAGLLGLGFIARRRMN